MFGLPSATFWWFIPWPFIWTALALYMYFKMKKEDELEGDDGEVSGT